MPGSGKTTVSKVLARKFEVPYFHSGGIVRDACPGAWIAAGDMAPEPCATETIEDLMITAEEFVLDGFPRSQHQLASPLVRYNSHIVYLDVTKKKAIERTAARGKNSPLVELHRITEQEVILRPVKTLASVVVPTTFRTPEAVVDTIIRWYTLNIHPSESGSLSR